MGSSGVERALVPLLMSGESLDQLVSGSVFVAIGLVALIFLPVKTRLMRESMDAAIRVYSTCGLEASDQWRDGTVNVLRIAMPILAILFGGALVASAVFWS
jgi:hypothetical protein